MVVRRDSGDDVYLLSYNIRIVDSWLWRSRMSIFDAVLVLFVRSQSEPTRELFAAYSAHVLHFLRVCMRFDLVADQIRHLIEAFAAKLAFIRSLVRMGKHVVSQIA